MKQKQGYYFGERTTIQSKSGEAYEYTINDKKNYAPFFLADISINTDEKPCIKRMNFQMGRFEASAIKWNGGVGHTVAKSGMCITKSGAKRKVLKQIKEFERQGGFDGGFQCWVDKRWY